MFPYIVIGKTSIPVFSVCAAVGIFTFVFSVMYRSGRLDRRDRETFFIVPKLFSALGFGFFGAVFFDALFKIPKNDGFKLSGIMFYGGEITGALALTVLIKLRERHTSLTTGEWLDTLTVPFVMFHCIGRVGCFFGGCCYGKTTDGIFGIAFPDIPSAGIFHNGQKVYPTQLFEAAGLAALAIVLLFIKRGRFIAYTLGYAVLRFALEFLRGDNRGVILAGLTPSQLLAVLSTYAMVAFITVKRISKRGGRLLRSV